jgi:hypothetical protein
MRALIIVLIYSLSTVVAADALEFGFTPVYNIYSPNSQLDNVPEIELFVSHRRCFANFTYSENLLRSGGQEWNDVTVCGLNIGYKWRLFKHIEGYFSFGGYYPSTEPRPTMNEASHYLFSAVLGISTGDPHYCFWDHYSYELDPSVGCTIGGRYLRQLSEYWSVGVGVSYRWLSFHETLLGWNGNYDSVDPHWEYVGERTFSGIRMGVTIEWKVR